MTSRSNARKLKNGMCHGFIVKIKTEGKHSLLFRRTKIINENDVIQDLITHTFKDEPGRRPVFEWARTYIEKNGGLATGNKIMTSNGMRPLISMKRVTPEHGLTEAEVEDMRFDFHRNFDHDRFVLLDQPVAPQDVLFDDRP